MHQVGIFDWNIFFQKKMIFFSVPSYEGGSKKSFFALDAGESIVFYINLSHHANGFFLIVNKKKALMGKLF